uniref:Uncharacterized protein n=1 Tax=Rhizophora mucronata TaxID=61149 RepID=A0A2P2Q811_RHIMU
MGFASLIPVFKFHPLYLRFQIVPKLIFFDKIFTSMKKKEEENLLILTPSNSLLLVTAT